MFVHTTEREAIEWRYRTHAIGKSGVGGTQPDALETDER